MSKNNHFKFILSARRKAQQGFSNVQIAIGILVGAIIMLGSLGGYQYIVQAKVNNEVSTISDLRSATLRYGQFAGAFSTTNVTLAILNGQNFFRSSGLTVTGAGTTLAVTNQWGGAVTATNSGGNFIDFTFNGVPDEACNEIARQLDNVVSQITINTTVTKAIGAASNLATVTTQCAANANSNTMIYRLQR